LRSPGSRANAATRRSGQAPRERETAPTHEEFEVSVSIEQIPAGTALDDQLRREQTRALLALLLSGQGAPATGQGQAGRARSR
jgi:hypothetical protein